MNINQIVEGHKAGTFVILAFINIDSERYAQVKCVDPSDHTRTSPGEFALPVKALREIK